MTHCWILIQDSIKKFHPANFSIVMATGIVSIAFEWMSFFSVARLLFAFNLLFYMILFVFLVARIMFFPSYLVADLRTIQRVFLFLTFVAGTNIVGVQLILFCQMTELAAILWILAVIGWLICVYFLLLDFSVIHSRSSTHKIVKGTTLLIVVSIVSISLLGMHLLNMTGRHTDFFHLVVLGFWCLGFILYLIIIASLIRSLFFVQFELKDWSAPYWICTGAAAIITLAGFEFMARMPELPAWEGFRETISWMTVFTWTVGTLWIPYLLVMDARKFMHTGSAVSAPLWIKIFPWSSLAFGKQHHTYEITSWSRVFPMGMYTASTLSFSRVTDFSFLGVIYSFWSWFALLIWLLTFIGMLRSVVFAFSHRENI